MRRDADELDGFVDFLAAEVSHPGLRAACDGCSRTPDSASCCGDFRRPSRTTRTRAGCWSTRSASPRSPARRRSCTRACATTCCSRRRCCTISAAPASCVPAPGFPPTDEGRLLGHVHLGLRLVEERTEELDANVRAELLHAIACHHDVRAARTAEAAVLYHANQLDAVAATRPVELVSTAPSRWITIAPVKSLALQPLDEVRLELEGAAGDRRFFLLDDDGRLLNAERLRPLVGVQARYDDGGEHARAALPGRRRRRRRGADRRRGRDARSSAARSSRTRSWGRGRRRCRRSPGGLSGSCGRATTDATDRGARGGVSLVSTAALDALARRGGLRGRSTAGASGCCSASTASGRTREDAWVGGRVRIGEAVAQLHGNVGRCVVTTHIPDTGVRDLDTLRTLEPTTAATCATTERLPVRRLGRRSLEPGTVRLGDTGRACLDVEADVQHVAVLDDVALPLEPLLPATSTPRRASPHRRGRSSGSPRHG